MNTIEQEIRNGQRKMSAMLSAPSYNQKEFDRVYAKVTRLQRLLAPVKGGCPYCGSYEGDSVECPECGHGQ